MSYQANLRAAYYTTVTTMLRSALRDERGLGCTYLKVLEWAQRIALDGACFLLGRDAYAGQRALNAVDSLERAGLGRLAHLAGIVATLIEAAERRNDAQGKTSGQAIVARWSIPVIACAKQIWRLGKRPFSPVNVVLFRAAA